MTGRMEDKHSGDTGCPEATKLLGYQSKCTECPFYPKKCVHEGRQPNPKHKEILMLFNHGGLSVNRIARRVGVSYRTVYRVTRKKE